MNLRVTIFVLVWLGLVEGPLSLAPRSALGDSGPTDRDRYQIVKSVHYGFLVTNTTGRVANDVRLLAHAPVLQTSNQVCVDLEASDDHDSDVDELGNQVIRFRFGELPPYGNRAVSINAVLRFSDIPRRLAVDPARFLTVEASVQSDDPDIAQAAHRLKGSTTLETARRTHQWVAGRVRYAGYLRDNRGALFALRTGRGDCTEYASLFVALCRANGIPARMVGGYVIGARSRLAPGGYHNWAEFFDQGVWRISDPQRRAFGRDEDSYVAMRIMGPSSKNPMDESQRFVTIGRGIESRMISPEGP